MDLFSVASNTDIFITRPQQLLNVVECNSSCSCREGVRARRRDRNPRYLVPIGLHGGCSRAGDASCSKSFLEPRKYRVEPLAMAEDARATQRQVRSLASLPRRGCGKGRAGWTGLPQRCLQERHGVWHGPGGLRGIICVTQNLKVRVFSREQEADSPGAGVLYLCCCDACRSYRRIAAYRANVIPGVVMVKAEYLRVTRGGSLVIQ